MAACKVFEKANVHILNPSGDKNLKYPNHVQVRLSYDPQGLSCTIFDENDTQLEEIPINSTTSCCKLHSKSYVFNSHEALLLTFQSETDIQTFDDALSKMREGKQASVFHERTDESSATQYFQFYSYLSQQQNMMQDYIRTGTYQQAILCNMADFKDKVVLDVGAGSGILSFFAAQAGAKVVYAVEASSMAQHCQTLVRTNNLQDKIKVIAGKIEEVDLPCQVDIIISEPMGYMLYNERMLETYIHARKWLRPSGKMFPSRGDLHVAPFCDETLYYEQLNKANFWYQNCFHGVDLSHLRDEALNEYLRQPIVDTFDISICLAKSVRHSLDFATASESDLHLLEIPLEFHILKSGMMHGLAFWFDVAFLGSTQTIWLSTAPTEPLTHWYQVRCLLEQPIFVKEGQMVRGMVQLVANRKQSYDVKLNVNIEGTNTSSTNVLDLKNPYFRYTGAAPQPPPGNNTVSPSEAYWNTVDEQALNMVNGITVNGLGEVALDQGTSGLQLAPSGRVQQQVVAQSHMQQPLIQQRTTTGSYPQMGVQSSSNFPVNNSLMIGDYAAPGSSMVLPTQGLHNIPHNQ